MIDPKLNELPVAPLGESDKVTGAEKTGAAADRLRRVSASLSVNDTVASNADLSVGGRGVDTSGVGAGSGAGAGMTKVSGSNAAVTEVVPGARGTGMTPVGLEETDTDEGAEYHAHSDLSALAYESWCERGCPEGSPDIDWEIAQQRLRTRRARVAGA